MTEKNDENERKRKASSILVLDYENFDALGKLCNKDGSQPRCPKASASPQAVATAVNSVTSANPSPPILGVNGVLNRSNNDAFVFKTPEKPAKRSKSQSKSPIGARRTCTAEAPTSSSLTTKLGFSSTPSGISKHPNDCEAQSPKLSPILGDSHRSAPPETHSAKTGASRRRIIIDQRSAIVPKPTEGFGQFSHTIQLKQLQLQPLSSTDGGSSKVFRNICPSPISDVPSSSTISSLSANARVLPSPDAMRALPGRMRADSSSSSSPDRIGRSSLNVQEPGETSRENNNSAAMPPSPSSTDGDGDGRQLSNASPDCSDLAGKDSMKERETPVSHRESSSDLSAR